MDDQKEEPSLTEINREKQNKIEKQIIYYPLSEQIDLSTYDEDTDAIDVSLSRLTCINDFSKFKNLRSICFRSNLLKTLVTNNLAPENGLLHINDLDFYDNQIEKIENLNQLVTLESLDLSFNRLSKIENLEMLVNLKKLFLVHNHFTKIGNLENLTKLELLELGDNQLRQIENLNLLTNLQQLFLGKNKIKKLENLNMPSLSVLSIQSNRISKIENLDNLVSLTELYLSDNGITKIEGLEKLTNLKTLDLASNKIERIENVEHLTLLEEFWFNNNNLSKWEDVDALKNLKSLKCLYLEHNPIYYINNVKPSSLNALTDNQTLNSSYRRKILLTLPNLEQLDATLCSKPSFVHRNDANKN